MEFCQSIIAYLICSIDFFMADLPQEIFYKYIELPMVINGLTEVETKLFTKKKK